MPEQVLAPFVPPGSDPVLPLGATTADLPLVASDIVNGNNFVSTGRELLVVDNTDVAAQTVTVVSAPDEHGRSGDIAAYPVPAGVVSILGPFKQKGWMRGTGTVRVNTSTATVKLGVIRLPSLP